MIDFTTLQPGDIVYIKAEFARHGDEKHIVLAHGHDGTWCEFPVVSAAVVGVEKAPQ